MPSDRLSASEAKRATAIAETPGWYSPWLHLCCTAGAGTLACIVSLMHIRDAGALEAIITIIGTLLFANLFEWTAHKYVMHRPVPFLRSLYETHTLLHHAVYTDRNMAIRARIEWKLTLMPAMNFLLVIGVAAGVSYGLAALANANVGWIALCTQAFYVTAFELSHLAYHLPTNHPVRRLPLCARLAEHHSRHHDLGLMGKWNFNITLPLVDWLFGTLAPKALVERRRLAAAK